ncbi:hypothetical protein [Sporisorium scitamineum]|uniref:RNA-dependent RNA polymerase n=1 Tax=Sporisorium scitamineum TaxID=49012 RepID=A0A0F7S139_9BASI|nr:hypothetical protein [Sporisorium scitamineum]
MKRKARIPAAGVTLLGIADEFGYLKEGEVFVQVEQVELGQVRRRILTGRKLVGRSPTIDPSDITMVQCKKPPPGHPLLQLRNVVVFNTCTPVQPLPRRLGGGDLDGDLYTIYEDERLFPPTPQPEVVFHNKVKPFEVPRACNVHDLADFFADFILNDFTGLVSSLHLRISDASEAGAADPRCKTLARLHSQATDFRKTGVAVKRQQLPNMHEPIVPDFLAQSEKRQGKLVYSSIRALGYLYRAVSWGDTDTPSLDENTDPETGLERVKDDAWLGDDGDEHDRDQSFSEIGSDYSGMMQEQEQTFTNSVHATMGAGTAPAFSATSSSTATALPSLASRISGLAVPSMAGSQPTSATSMAVAPWQFKDKTFPQFLERIGWTNQHFLSPSKKDADAIQEGHRYIPVFLDFTTELRRLSRKLAEYHPNVARLNAANGAGGQGDGIYLISEVHLLTGRLPWAKVAKRTRTDHDNDLLDSMQSLTSLLRKNLCRISEEAAFGKARRSAESGTASVQAVESNQTAQVKASAASFSRLIGEGTAEAPFELASSDEESSRSNTTGRRSTTPRSQEPPSLTSAASVTRSDFNNGIKRKASREIDDERRSRSHTPTASQLNIQVPDQQQLPRATAEDPSTPTAPLSPASFASQSNTSNDVIQLDEKTVDSLWKACHFFCSPSRPRYSNIYGYNTFMITLTLHLIFMIETLKHLHRTSAGRRYFRRSSNKDKGKAKQVDVKTESVDDGFGDVSGDTVLQGGYDEVADGRDDDYSLTEDTMNALSLGQMIDFSQIGFDG